MRDPKAICDEPMLAEEADVEQPKVFLDEVDEVLIEFWALANELDPGSTRVMGRHREGKALRSEAIRDKVTEIKVRRKAIDLDAKPTNVKMGDFISIGGVVYMVSELNPQVGIPDVAVLVLQEMPVEEEDE